MRLVPTDRSELKKFYKKTALQELIEEFQNMDCDCVEVAGADKHYSNMASGQSALKTSIKRYGAVGIQASAHNGKLYLIKTSEDER